MNEYRSISTRKACSGWCEPEKGIHVSFQFGRRPVAEQREKLVGVTLVTISNTSAPNHFARKAECIPGCLLGPFTIIEIEEPTEFDQTPTDDVFIYPSLVKVQVIDDPEFWDLD